MSFTRKLKVAVICDQTEIHGGRERVVCDLCNELSAFCDVYLINLWKNPCAYTLCEKVHKVYLHDRKKRLRYMLWGSVRKLRRFLKEENINVILCDGLSAVLEIFLVTRGLPVKVLYREHTGIKIWKQRAHSGNKRNLYYQRTLRFIVKRYIATIVVLTEGEFQNYRKIMNISLNKIMVIPNFMNEELFRDAVEYDVNSHAIITVGRIDYQKGYEYLIEVAKKVFDRYPDWHWDIYGGDGKDEYVKHIRDLISGNGLENHVFLKGICNHVYDMYPKYGVYVMTSRHEGLPTVLLEAKAKKLPLVSFDIESGPADIIRDGIDGYLVSPFDTDTMAEKICYLIEHPEVRKDFSDHTYENIDKFRKETILAKWKDLIEGMMGEKDESEST